MNYKLIRENLLQFLLIFLSLLSFMGSIIYLFYSLNIWGIFISLSLTLVLFFVIVKWYSQNKSTTVNLKKIEPKTKNINSIIYIILFLFCLIFLLNSRTSAPITSPWQVVPKVFFLFYFFSTLFLALANFKREAISHILIIFHFILSFSVCAIIYIIGYGFDPFIHRAALETIDATGKIEPKTFYYIGQYSIEIFLKKITFLPFEKIDKFLVPFASAILIPLSFFKIFDSKKNDKQNYNISVLSLLIIPFSIFIITVPQNLAYLFLILIIIFSFNTKNNINLIVAYLLSISCFFIHPIVGIPSILFVISITINNSKIKNNFKKFLYSINFFLMASVLPLLFFYLEKNINSQISIISLISLKNIKLNFPIMPSQENFILNALYLYGFNIAWFLFLVTMASVFISFKKNNLKYKKIYLLSAFSVLISYFITLNIPFDYLVDYERSYYSKRLLIVLLIFCLPFLFDLFLELTKKILYQNKNIKYIFLIFLSLLATISLYLSYPRYDNYFNSRGYSTSDSDIKAVKWVENDAQGNNFIVLAHQQLSAAALKEFGFKKYYEDDIFYYPIPTGGKLYSIYLDLMEAPSKEKIKNAMDITGVDLAYFIVNKYWWASEKIVDEAKNQANSCQKIDNGEVFIFKFLRD